ncbi:MAG: polyphosphate kinase 2 family protein [Gemmataceae bacterium]|nr:polyphosphate kinase 2 family protein [Gemmataceae bacterium]
MPIPIEHVLDHVRVPPGKRVRLKDYDPDWAGDESTPLKDRKEKAGEVLAESVAALTGAQELLYASDTYSILVILQATDAAGKDGIIKHVMSGVNPKACRVHAFKQPTPEELDHNFLWRCMKVLPERGQIGIFNRSYYEEVLVVKVHPELVDHQRIPGARVGKQFWNDRYEDINAFERHLTRNGTVVVKFFLHISKKEQRKRFLDRIEEPEKHWKFSPGDVAEREHWDDYMQAFEDMLNATSTTWAPWHVIPSDRKWVSRAIVAKILASTIDGLDLRYPETSPAKRRQIEDARKKLENE